MTLVEAAILVPLECCGKSFESEIIEFDSRDSVSWPYRQEKDGGEHTASY
jgi:hypothetical protein